MCEMIVQVGSANLTHSSFSYFFRLFSSELLYKRKVLNFYKYENVINLIKNDLKQIPFTKPEKFVIIEIFDGAKYEKYFSDKITYDSVHKFIETLK